MLQPLPLAAAAVQMLLATVSAAASSSLGTPCVCVLRSCPARPPLPHSLRVRGGPPVSDGAPSLSDQWLAFASERAAVTSILALVCTCPCTYIQKPRPGPPPFHRQGQVLPSERVPCVSSISACVDEHSCDFLRIVPCCQKKFCSCQAI